MALSPRLVARIAALALAWSASPPALAADQEPTLPRGFRGWTHVRSMVVTDADHGMYGFHNVYANQAALKTLRSGAARPSYPEGAQFVVSIFEVKEEQGLVVAGPKQRDVVQTKDRKAVATGGWRFASFDPSGKPNAVDAAACHACHAQARATDLVFTRFAE
jgi:hypothetical protein